MQARNLSSRVMSPEFQERFVRTAGINPMGFLIPASETFIDLNRSYVEMEVKIQISTPAILAYNTVIYPAHHDQIVVRPHQRYALGSPVGSLSLQSILRDYPEQQSERWGDHSSTSRMVQQFGITRPLDSQRRRCNPQ